MCALSIGWPQAVALQYAFAPPLESQRVAAVADVNRNAQCASPRAWRQRDIGFADQLTWIGGQDVRKRAPQHGVVVLHHVTGEDQTDVDGPVAACGRLQGVSRRHKCVLHRDIRTNRRTA